MNKKLSYINLFLALFISMIILSGVALAEEKNPFLDKELVQEPVLMNNNATAIRKIPMPPPPSAVQSAKISQPQVENSISLLGGFRLLGTINNVTTLVNDKTGEIKFYPNKNSIGIAVGTVEFRADKEIVFVYKDGKDGKPNFKEYFPVLGVDLKKKYEISNESNGVKICFDGKMYELASLGWVCSDNLKEVMGR